MEQLITLEGSEGTTTKPVARRKGRGRKSHSYHGFLSHVKWTLRRSRLRKDIFRLLVEIYPDRSYPAEIARTLGSTPSNVRCALSGAPWGQGKFNTSYSLLSMKLVGMEEVDGRKYYKATNKGMEIARALGAPKPRHMHRSE